MKIIAVDNFDRENRSDILIAENLNKDRAYGESIVKFLNDQYGGELANEYYKLVEDDYKLYKFEP